CWRPKSRVTSSCAAPGADVPAPKPQPRRASASAASAAATAPAAAPRTLVRRTHLHLEPVRTHRVLGMRLQAVGAGRREGELHVAVLAGRVAANDGALERLSGLAVDHREGDLAAGGRAVRSAQLELRVAEGVVGDQHVVARLDPLLAAADLGVLVVEDLPPVAVVLGVARVRTDPVDVE